jgi:hypothetical protein
VLLGQETELNSVAASARSRGLSVVRLDIMSSEPLIDEVSRAELRLQQCLTVVASASSVKAILTDTISPREAALILLHSSKVCSNNLSDDD